MVACRDGPVVAVNVRGWDGGALLVREPGARLRAQDRRRLHRLGLRPRTGGERREWTWVARPAALPEGGTAEDLARTRLLALMDVDMVCRTQLVAVLRDALRLEPEQLCLLLPEEEADEEPGDDDAWADNWGDVG